jgi:hypothetical protein
MGNPGNARVSPCVVTGLLSQYKRKAPLTSNEDIRLALRLPDHQIDLLMCV